METNSAINQFIIQTVLITPIEDIITKLEKKEFRDCDIKWLDKKLENFTEFACETLGIKVSMPSQIEGKEVTLLNDYLVTQYSNLFNTLLTYFKKF